MRLDCKPVEKTQVDFTDCIEVIDGATGRGRKTQIFVGVLAFSSRVYGEFVWDLSLRTRGCGTSSAASRRFGHRADGLGFPGRRTAVPKHCAIKSCVEYRRRGTGGGELVKRTQKGATLTPGGLTVLVLAQEISESVRAHGARLEAFDPELGCEIVIGTYESIAVYYWPKILRQLQVALPNVQVSMRTGRSDEPDRVLVKGEFDLVVTVRSKPRRGIVNVGLFRDRIEIYILKGLTPSEASHHPVSGRRRQFRSRDSQRESPWRGRGVVDPRPQPCRRVPLLAGQ